MLRGFGVVAPRQYLEESDHDGLVRGRVNVIQFAPTTRSVYFAWSVVVVAGQPQVAVLCVRPAVGAVEERIGA